MYSHDTLKVNDLTPLPHLPTRGNSNEIAKGNKM